MLALLAATFLLSGCFDRKQTTTLNPDGSGKMTLETLVAVPTQAPPGQPKPTAESFGRQVAADLINNTLGVDAWAGVEVSQTADGRARIVATAYFPNLNAVRFHLLPLAFGWKRDAESGVFTIERTRTTVRSYASLSDDELKKLVAQAQSDFATQKPTLKVQMEAFTLEMHFELPGEVTDAQLLTRDGNTVSLTLDGKKAFVALEKFMADDAALAATFKKGEDSPANDDIMLASMYGQKGPIAAQVKLTSQTRVAFDYHTEARVAQLAQAEMLKQAGVELIPRFIVNDPQPATTTSKPASRPAPARGR